MTRETDGTKRSSWHSESRARLRDQKGQGLIEYVILVALVVLVCVGATKALGGKVHSKLKEIRDQIDEGVPVRLNP